MKKIYIDVTNIATLDYLTGIQRVVREVVLRMLRNHDIEMNLLVYNARKKKYELIDNEAFKEYFSNYAPQKLRLRTNGCVEINGLEEGSFFYDIDAVWQSDLKRSYLYPVLKECGVEISVFVHDVIPITDPQYCHMDTVCRFIDYIGAVLNYADKILVSTKATQKVLIGLTKEIGAKETPIFVTGLGADFSKNKLKEECIDGEVENFIKSGKKYVLLVGTIEPRKNHAILLDAFEKSLFEKGLVLVFAGRYGWNIDSLRKRIEECPELGKGLQFFQGKNDTTIDFLYKNAFLAVFPSFNEGFGLPIIEAFERGTPVIASDCDVLKEVGKDYGIYCSPAEVDDWIKKIVYLFENEDRYEELKGYIKNYKPDMWDEVVDKMVGCLIKNS